MRVAAETLADQRGAANARGSSQPQPSKGSEPVPQTCGDTQPVSVTVHRHGKAFLSTQRAPSLRERRVVSFQVDTRPFAEGIVEHQRTGESIAGIRTVLEMMIGSHCDQRQSRRDCVFEGGVDCIVAIVRHVERTVGVAWARSTSPEAVKICCRSCVTCAARSAPDRPGKLLMWSRCCA